MTESQAASITRSETWVPPEGALGRLTAAAIVRAAALSSSAQTLEHAAARREQGPSFLSALRRHDVAVIAELKRRSPSRGVINDALRVEDRAQDYTVAGAAALSVLTESVHFGGSLADLHAASEATKLPLLRKDFIVDRLQLLEARAAGASAVLLIARALSAVRFSELAAQAHALGLDVLLEVRDERELERALRVERAVIGINNRNLETLAVDDAVSAFLLPLVPVDRAAVYESGIHDRAGVMRAAEQGADAVLVGSSLSTASNARAAVAALTGVPRRGRGR
ncbi:MAG TPA: indole-3-glycerol phosphate synthase TrpC [Gemmatimonadaceae bacterium]|nr:indole-3-glycerol phosphate synthase TrpC [Gemmatimonadaceae bacterium]